MERNILVSDVTMKQTDSQQGAALSFRQKIELAKLLNRLGVSVIETSPILGDRTNILLVKSLASAIRDSILAVPVDFTDLESPALVWGAVAGAAHPRLQVSVPVSAVQMEYLTHRKPAAVLQLISAQVAACAALCPDVEFIAQDFARSDESFLADAVNAAIAAGAKTVTFWDSACTLLPEDFAGFVKRTKASLPSEVRLGVLCTNDLYLADACAVAAVCAGADEIKTMPYGNDIVSLKRFSRILNTKSDVCNASCSVNLTELDRVISQIKILCEAKSGKASKLVATTPVSEELKLTVSDNLQTVLRAVSQLGYDLSEEDGLKVYETFVRLASMNSEVSAKELDAIVASVAFQVPPTYRLESFVINSGNTISATCHLRLRKGEELLENVCVGDGPVDAAFQAIEKVVGRHFELDDFQIQSVAEGREAMGETVVRLRHEGRVQSGRGVSRDIIASSLMAYINAVNKIVYEEE